MKFRTLSIMPILLAIFCVSITSCYDDTELRGQLENHEQRISKLETLCKQINTNISALQTIVDALQKNDYITSTAPITESGVEVGYTITFTSGKTITIYHGKNVVNGTDGKDGVDGHTPVVGVKQDTDGIYYWTIDGEWLHDDAGNKIMAVGTDGKDGTNGQDGKDGKDGITPQLKIEENYWYVSYDNGATWQQLCKAVGEDGAAGADGDAFFQSVKQDEISVTFVLADGTSITVSKFVAREFAIAFDETEDIYCEAGQTVAVAFTITGGGDNVSVECLGENGWAGKVFMSGPNSGTIKVTAPDPIMDGKILVFATNGTKEVVMKALTFTDKVLKSVNDLYEASYSGEDIYVPISTSVEYLVNIPTDAQSWISHTATKALVTETLTFTIAENPDEVQRSADIELTSIDGKMSFTITILQKAQPSSAVIEFADDVMKELCVAAFDTNQDGELSYKEAAAVTDLNQMTLSKKTFKSFDEFQYFINVTTIPDSYFSGIGIKSIVLPEGLKTIGISAFRDCVLLSEIVIPESVTRIRSYAFYNCTSLTSITIPESVTRIEDYTFYSCDNLASITIPEGVKHIGLYAFAYCGSLTSITIPEGVTYIDTIFEGCSSLTSITIPETVTNIGGHTFAHCSSLTSITIPETVKSIGNSVFYYCTSLTSITIPENITSIGASAFSHCESLVSITIPESVTRIEEATFDNCTSLTSITLPESVMYIGTYAFYKCKSLASITIPESVRSMGSYVLQNCSNLGSVYLKATEPASMGSEVFRNNASGRKIYVPADAVETYKSADGWLDYASSIYGYDYENGTVVE